MRTVMVAAFRYRHEGEFAKATLESAGVPCILVADDGGGMRPEIMGVNPVRLYVTEHHEAQAREILSHADDHDDDDHDDGDHDNVADDASSDGPGLPDDALRSGDRDD
jgi:hypothetical protein